MVFSSEIFLFLYLPLFLAVYTLAPWRMKSAVIVLGSYLFYGWWRLDYLGLLILTTAWSYVIGHLIRKAAPRAAKVWTGIGVAGCLSVLGVFKYFNFFVDSLAAFLGTDAASLGIHWQILLPIGVSFYVFHCISYIVDVYRGDAGEPVSFLDFAAFVALFPQLVAGPILRFKDLAHQFRHRVQTMDMLTDGLMLFTVGLAKKVLLADSAAPLADAAFGATDPGLLLSWLGALAYMMQIYFDFSGYSDMALGLGLMLGFRFWPNFDLPYTSRSITEFWRRWHISLSVWLRDYLYIPLGGNRISPRRTYVNLLTVMVLGGLWHGAAWTFILWGIWHGGWLAVERATGLAKAEGAAALARTFLIVLISWVMFRAATVGEAFDIYAGMIGANGSGLDLPEWFSVTSESVSALVFCLVAVVLEPAARQGVSATMVVRADGTLTISNSAVPVAIIAALGTLAIMRLAEQSHSPFLYFQF
jgi:alginate O-acetyltransferase complex protein AlgI